MFMLLAWGAVVCTALVGASDAAKGLVLTRPAKRMRVSDTVSQKHVYDLPALVLETILRVSPLPQASWLIAGMAQYNDVEAVIMAATFGCRKLCIRHIIRVVGLDRVRAILAQSGRNDFQLLGMYWSYALLGSFRMDFSDALGEPIPNIRASALAMLRNDPCAQSYTWTGREVALADLPSDLRAVAEDIMAAITTVGLVASAHMHAAYRLEQYTPKPDVFGRVVQLLNATPRIPRISVLNYYSRLSGSANVNELIDVALRMRRWDAVALMCNKDRPLDRALSNEEARGVMSAVLSMPREIDGDQLVDALYLLRDQIDSSSFVRTIECVSSKYLAKKPRRLGRLLEFDDRTITLLFLEGEAVYTAGVALAHDILDDIPRPTRIDCLLGDADGVLQANQPGGEYGSSSGRRAVDGALDSRNIHYTNSVKMTVLWQFKLNDEVLLGHIIARTTGREDLRPLGYALDELGLMLISREISSYYDLQGDETDRQAVTDMFLYAGDVELRVIISAFSRPGMKQCVRELLKRHRLNRPKVLRSAAAGTQWLSALLGVDCLVPFEPEQ